MLSFFRDVITSVKVVDGVLNVNTVPELDSDDSVDNLLTKPSSIDYVIVWVVYVGVRFS